MPEILRAEWHAEVLTDSVHTVIPDGCRDLIIVRPTHHRPYCFVSPLYDQTQWVASQRGTQISGFRLTAGSVINEHSLLSSIDHEDMDKAELLARLEDFVKLDTAVAEALPCLAQANNSVTTVARSLGVSIRTLQRMMLKQTARSPSYWLQLARSRRAARALFGDMTDADVAVTYGYADQAHLCRDIKRWFNMTPAQLQNSHQVSDQLQQPAYA